MSAGMLEWARRLHPFTTPESQRLALLFGVVYFAQGMWYLPNQAITIVLKDRGLTAGQVADFFLISTIPWLIKPLYGILSDFVPLLGRRRHRQLHARRRRRPLHADGVRARLHRRPDRRDDGRERPPARPHRRLPVGAVGVHHGRLGARGPPRGLLRRAPEPPGGLP